MKSSPFDITGPSLIAKDLGSIRGPLTRGMVASQAVKRKEKREGKNPGSIAGISHKADELVRKGRSA